MPEKSVLATVPLRWMTPEQAGQYVKVSHRTLERMRSAGSGPRFHVSGHRKVVYDIADLDAWILSRGGAR